MLFANRFIGVASQAVPRYNMMLGRSFASVGDKLPSVELHQGFPPKKHNLADFAKDKSILLVGLPGGKSRTIKELGWWWWSHTFGFSHRRVFALNMFSAFTPTWSTKQIPNYLENQDALRSAGIHTVIVYCVNDAAVMQAWGKNQKVGLVCKMLCGCCAS